MKKIKDITGDISKQAKDYRDEKKEKDPGNPFNKSMESIFPDPKLKGVYKVYKKWLKVADTKRIDSGLAVMLSRMVLGTKLWLIYVGKSGDWKSEQIHALECRKGITTKTIKCFTAKTLVNGSIHIQDLAPKLKNNVVLIPEMAQLLTLHPNEKAQVWAQLRDLYDGKAGKQSGMGADADYKDLNVSFIGGSTPAIDSQILIHQNLGSREMIWRTSEKDADIKEQDDIMEKVWKNEEAEGTMREEIHKVTQDFIANTKYNPKIKIKEVVKDKIKTFAMILSNLRAIAEVDRYTGELLNDVHTEIPSRVLKQLKRFFIALKSLDPEYTDERALDVLQHIVRSSCLQNRLKLFEFMLKENPPNEYREDFTRYELAKELSIGVKTIYRELNVLTNLKILSRRDEVIKTSWGEERYNYFWKINPDNWLVKKYQGK